MDGSVGHVAVEPSLARRWVAARPGPGLRRRIGEADFQAAYAEGLSLGLSQSVAMARTREQT